MLIICVNALNRNKHVEFNVIAHLKAKIYTLCPQNLNFTYTSPDHPIFIKTCLLMIEEFNFLILTS